MMDGVQSLEGKVPWRHLVGLEHSSKGKDRFVARTAEDMRVKGRTVDEAMATMGDAIRYTFEYPADRYTEGMQGDISQLAAQGFIQVRRQNAWTWPEHKGIVSCWRDPKSGQLFEVQFHIRPSYEAWQLTHPMYERLRHPSFDDAARAEFKTFIRKVYRAFDQEPASEPSGSVGSSSEKVTYYAIVDDLSSPEQPAGVLRRIEHEGGQRDEAFGYDLAWRHTFLLYSAERGNLDNRLQEIGEDEAYRIEARIRRSRTNAN
jgi:hypothetical protein